MEGNVDRAVDYLVESGVQSLMDLPYDDPIRDRVVIAFNELANAQRGLPERLATGGKLAEFGAGMFQWMCEHAGDLTHRMSEDTATTPGFHMGLSYVKEKVDRLLHYLGSEYGFAKEVAELSASNYRFRVNEGSYQGTEEEWERERMEAGHSYAAAHLALTVYNEAQATAKAVAVAMGKQSFTDAQELLGRLARHLASDWEKYAGQFELDSMGNVIRYSK